MSESGPLLTLTLALTLPLTLPLTQPLTLALAHSFVDLHPHPNPEVLPTLVGFTSAMTIVIYFGGRTQRRGYEVQIFF